jgi:iron complex outermembrane receptor protein
MVNAQNKLLTGKVSDTKDPMPGVTVVLKGTKIGTVTNEAGEFKLNVPKSGGTLTFSFVGFTSKDVEIGNNTTFDILLQSDITQLAEVAVVGSRNARRTQLDTPAPVDIISVAEISSTMPQPDLAQMLKQIAPSFNALQAIGGDLDSHVVPVQLRNQPPNQTLLLVNGKRRHVSSLLQLYNKTGPSTSADLMTIPSIAVNKVSILRDGAAAQYGSDAIAGVMNLDLKSSVNELTASYYTSIFKAGDGLTNQFMVNYGLPLGTKGGFINISGEFTHRNKTSRTPDGGYNGSIYGNAYLNNTIKDEYGKIIVTNPEALASPDNAALKTDEGLLKARGLTRDDFQMINGLSQMTNGTVFANLSLPISSTSRFYAFGGLNYRNTLSGCYYRFPRQLDRSNYAVYPNGYLPQLTSSIADKSLSMGLQGKIGVFDIDFSNTFGSSNFDYGMTNTLNASYGSESPTTMSLGANTFTQNTTSLAFSHYFNDPLNGAVKGINVAFGTEMRVENFAIKQGQEESYTKGTAGIFVAPSDNFNYTQNINPDVKDDKGNDIILSRKGDKLDFKNYSANCQCFRGFAPNQAIDAKRDVVAGYVDVEVDVNKKLLLAAATRFERYSDFGSVITGKFAARYSIFDNFNIRGSVSNGFRAPSLHELYYAQTSTVFTPQGVPFDVGFFTNESSAAKALGIPKLKQENSQNASLGFALQPLQGLEITTDAYIFTVKDKIILTGNFEGPAVGGRLKSVIGEGAAQFFTNGADVKSKGLDLVVNYTKMLGTKKMIATFAGNWNKVEFVAVHPAKLNVGTDGTLTEAQIQDLYLSRSVRASYEEGNPRQKYIASFTLLDKKWSAMVRGVYYGSVYSRSSYDDGNGNYYDYKLAARTTVDLSLGYELIKGLKLSVGGDNLFDVYPTRILPDLTDNNRFGYENYQMGFQGASYYARLNYKF